MASAHPTLDAAPSAELRDTADASGRGLPPWAPLLALGGLFCLLTAWSWRKWADPLVDFGREPYLSWQVLEGRALYADLASLFGPLSPYVNALWFWLFGVSLTTLAACNLGIAAALAAIVYRFLATACDRLTAMLGTTVLLVSFVFPNHLEDAANYNFVFPYTYAATHGTVLLVCGVFALSRALLTSGSLAWLAAGVCMGATLLTKPEIALAAVATSVLALAWQATDAPATRQRPPGPLLLLVGAALPLAVFAVLLGPHALLMPWVSVARLMGTQSIFYAHLMGTDDLHGNALRLLVDAVLWSAVLGALLVTDVRYRRHARRHSLIRLFAIAAVGLLAVRDIPGIGRSLSLLLPAAGTSLAWVAWRRRRQARDVTRLVPLVLWTAAAWVLLGKMLLNVRFHHYGFYLAMPAALSVVALGVGALPRLLAERYAGAGWLLRPVSVCGVLLLLAHSFSLSSLSYAHMDTPVGRGVDLHMGPSARPFPTGTTAAAAQGRIEALTPPDATLAVLPEGTMLNFLTRRPNPTPYHQLTPPEVKVYGVPRVLAAFQHAPPDYILFIEVPGFEYGLDSFDSAGWGAELVAWVRSRYEVVEAVPQADTWGFTLWRRGSALRSRQ